jgi:glycine cleavage system H protein
VKKDADMAVVESVKAASDVYAPVTGDSHGSEHRHRGRSAKVNEDPEGAGWFVKMKLSDKGELSGLMDKAAYDAFCATQ